MVADTVSRAGRPRVKSDSSGVSFVTFSKIINFSALVSLPIKWGKYWYWPQMVVVSYLYEVFRTLPGT